jgi:LPXTG-motif cell wall-anchored protein
LISVDGQTYELDGSLSTAVVPSHWNLAGTSQGYAVYTFDKPPAPITATTSSGRRLAVTVLSSTTKSEEIKVDAPSTSSVVRSVAWDSGWRATVSVNGGPARAVSVNSYDLVQQVRLPPGRDVVTFHYRPAHLTLATVLSLGAIGVLLVLLAGWLVRRRRRQPAEPDVAPVVEREPEAVSI